MWNDHLKNDYQALNAAVVAPDPVTEGFSPFVPSSNQSIKIGDASLAFDATTGALSELDVDGISWASATNTLLAIEYQTYNISQFQAFQRAYSNLTNPPGYFPHDFGKPNDTIAVAHVQSPVARKFWMKQGQHNEDEAAAEGSMTSFLIELSFNDSSLLQEYGAPQSIWTRLDVKAPAVTDTVAANHTGTNTESSAAVSIGVTVDLIGKVATRHAEATFLRFAPANV